MAIAGGASDSGAVDFRTITVPCECQPWRAVVEEVLRESADLVWDATVPSPGDAANPDAPLLAGVRVALRRDVLARVRHRWVDAAARGDTRFAGGLAAWLDEGVSARLFEASLDGQHAVIEMMAERGGVDVETAESVAYLLPVPFLQACQRRLVDRVNPSWSRGFCPVCGSWPAFAEVLGIERARRLRCGRCGAAWHAQPLWCAFCGTRDHADLVTLVPGDDLACAEAGTPPSEAGIGSSGTGVVDACTRCSHYVKRLTTFQGCAPLAVMLQDLGSVALDVAAIEEGYSRPRGTGYALGVTLNEV